MVPAVPKGARVGVIFLRGKVRDGDTVRVPPLMGWHFVHNTWPQWCLLCTPSWPCAHLQDCSFWKGHYGTKFACPQLTFIHDAEKATQFCGVSPSVGQYVALLFYCFVLCDPLV